AAGVWGVLAATRLPCDSDGEVFGTATVRRAALARVLACGAAARIGIFLLLQAAGASWRRAGLMLLSLPLSAVGCVVAAPLAGGGWNIAGPTRFFAVLALAVRRAGPLCGPGPAAAGAGAGAGPPPAAARPPAGAGAHAP